MEKYLTYFLAIFLALLIFSMPICFAAEINNAYKTTNTDTNTSNPERQQKAAVIFLPFVGLGAAAVAALLKAGITYIAVGGVAIVGTLVVMHITTTSWLTYTTNYINAATHMYDHKNDFPYELGSNPKPEDYKKLCKDMMNKVSKNASDYSTAIQSDGRFVRITNLKNTTSRIGKYAVIIGDKDGKTMITCHPESKSEIINKIRSKYWQIKDGFASSWK